MLAWRGIWRMAVRNVATTNNHLMVRAGLSKKPRKTLFIDGDKKVSYGEFLNWSGKYAGLLSSNYDICKGDRVMCRTSKTLDSVALYLACLQLGAIYIPVNPLYTQHETEHFVEDATPKLMVTCDVSKDKVFCERIANIVDEKSLPAKAKSAEAVLDIEHVESNDVACVLYTSGTTGLPKGAMLTHGCLSTNAEALVDEWRFTEHDKLLHMLPFYHVHGMFISLNCSLFSHSTVIWRERFSVEDSIKLLPSTTVLMGVPTFYRERRFCPYTTLGPFRTTVEIVSCRLLSSPKFNAGLLHQLRLFTCGSAPLSTQLWREFKSRSGHEILERYGMTEAQVISSNPYDDRRPGTVGKPVGDTKIRISDSGMVEIQSSSLFSGYWKNPKKTAEDFTQDTYFITGDLGTIDDDGFLHILGRGKDLIIVGGYNVYPKEVEDCIEMLPDVAEAAVIGVPHKDLGEAVVAVVCIDNATSVDAAKKEREIIEELKKMLGKYKVPKRVVFVPSLPKNSMAKIQKKELREQYKAVCEEK